LGNVSTECDCISLFHCNTGFQQTIGSFVLPLSSHCLYEKGTSRPDLLAVLSCTFFSHI
jgi:hypothetical protein